MIRLLLIEDVLADAELTVRRLRAEGLDCHWQRVECEAGLRAALDDPWDLIISDYHLPAFDGLEALSIAQAVAPTVPFVFVSGTLGFDRAQHALAAGALGWIDKADPRALAATVRAALATTSHRRRTDDKPADASHVAAGVAHHLLERRSALDDALRHRDEVSVANIMRRAPPAPAALLWVATGAVRDRFAKVLGGANIEVDAAGSCDDALRQLASRIHALFFTDDLACVREVRQLSSGAATHVVYVHADANCGAHEGLQAGASDCMSSEGRGETFWAQISVARRIVDLASSLQLALTDNRLLTTIDELTQTGSRRFFEHEFPREVERAGRAGQSLALIMCDIDHFKQINDRWGHPVGDEVLREFAHRLSAGLRRTDWVARTGGEEFAVVLPEAGPSEALMIAKRLCDRVRSMPIVTSADAFTVTASFGVCALERVPRQTREAPAELVRAADGALYASKHQGRNRVTLSACAATVGEVA